MTASIFNQRPFKKACSLCGKMFQKTTRGEKMCADCWQKRRGRGLVKNNDSRFTRIIKSRKTRCVYCGDNYALNSGHHCSGKNAFCWGELKGRCSQAEEELNFLLDYRDEKHTYDSMLLDRIRKLRKQLK